MNLNDSDGNREEFNNIPLSYHHNYLMDRFLFSSFSFSSFRQAFNFEIGLIY